MKDDALDSLIDAIPQVFDCEVCLEIFTKKKGEKPHTLKLFNQDGIVCDSCYNEYNDD